MPVGSQEPEHGEACIFGVPSLGRSIVARSSPPWNARKALLELIFELFELITTLGINSTIFCNY